MNKKIRASICFYGVQACRYFSRISSMPGNKQQCSISDGLLNCIDYSNVFVSLHVVAFPSIPVPGLTLWGDYRHKWPKLVCSYVSEISHTEIWYWARLKKHIEQLNKEKSVLSTNARRVSMTSACDMWHVSANWRRFIDLRVPRFRRLKLIRQ